MASSHQPPSLPSLPPFSPLPPLQLPARPDSPTLSVPFIQSPAPSFADSFSTALTSPPAADNVPTLSPDALVPPSNLRKSISVDSFVHYAREQPTRSSRSPTVSAADPSKHLPPYIHKRERDHRPSARNRGTSIGSVHDRYDSPALVDSDVDRYDPFNPSSARFRRGSLKGQDPQRQIRAGELALPSRAPTLSTASSISSSKTASTGTASTSILEEFPHPLIASSSLQSLPPRKTATSFTSSNPGRTRSGSLGIYATSVAARRTATHTAAWSDAKGAVTLAVVGAAGCGKSSVIKKGLAGYRLSLPTTFFAPRTSKRPLPCYTRRSVHFNEGTHAFPLHIVEVDIPQSTEPTIPYDLPWPEDQPPLDGILICYDSSNAASFQPVEGLLQSSSALKLPIIVLACKVDLERQLEPEKALEILQPYDVGLVEVTSALDGGKSKMRQSFDFLLKAILRERRADKIAGSDMDYKNPASPDVIAQAPPWESSRTSTPTVPSPVVSANRVTPSQSSALRPPTQPSIPSPTPPLVAPTVPNTPRPLVIVEARAHGMPSIPEPKEAPKERESRPAQWATLDELLDKLLFLAVSGDDPTFITHFLLTYRRFTTPRSVLLAMQKRMRQLDNPSGDPMFACFAQMRICHLLQTWIESYPDDFAVKGTQGALTALVKSIISKTHLLHYGSEFLPFLEMIPNLQDRDSTWAMKADVSADESDDSSFLEEDEDEAHEMDKHVVRSKDISGEQPALDNRLHPLPLRERKASLPLPRSLAISSTTMNGSQVEDVDPSPKQLIRDLLKLSQEVMTLDPEEVAQEITSLELRLFLDIKPRHWLYYTFVSGKKGENEPITAFNAVSNHLADWVVSLILCHDKPSKRARQIEKLVEIAQRLRAHNNYSALRAFVAGINNATFPGDETMEVFKNKSPEHLKNFQSWDVLLQQIRAHRAYRLALRNTKGACIPAMEVHMSDLIRAHEGNEDFNPTDPSKIHWGKFNMMGRFIGTTTQFQAQCQNTNDYNFPERKVIRELLARSVMNVEMQKSRMMHDEDDVDYRSSVSPSNQPKDLASIRRLFFW
ncbi:ras guanine nucleotide exchange factor domain-containing protein [Cyathus striatus]|nr:ras guanine nucleotide exchange factor domain-containing protein [Cyathus striatus]